MQDVREIAAEIEQHEDQIRKLRKKKEALEKESSQAMVGKCFRRADNCKVGIAGADEPAIYYKVISGFNYRTEGFRRSFCNDYFVLAVDDTFPAGAYAKLATPQPEDSVPLVCTCFVAADTLAQDCVPVPQDEFAKALARKASELQRLISSPACQGTAETAAEATEAAEKSGQNSKAEKEAEKQAEKEAEKTALPVKSS